MPPGSSEAKNSRTSVLDARRRYSQNLSQHNRFKNRFKNPGEAIAFFRRKAKLVKHLVGVVRFLVTKQLETAAGNQVEIRMEDSNIRKQLKADKNM